MITKEQQMDWAKLKMTDSPKKGVLLYLPNAEIFVFAKFGDGDNLLEEDMRDGYNDYIYVVTYKFNQTEFIEEDGGLVMFNNEKGTEKYMDYYESLEHFVKDSLESLEIEDNVNTEYIILKLFL